MGDHIIIEGIRGYGYHGVFDHERTEGQDFVVDVDLEIARGSGVTDDLAQTVDYGVVAQRIHDLITGSPRSLIERLAQDIADTCLAIPGVESVRIRLHKPSAPIPVPFTDVIVSIERP